MSKYQQLQEKLTDAGYVLTGRETMHELFCMAKNEFGWIFWSEE